MLKPDSDIESIARNIQAGDTVVLKDGQWTDAKLKFEQLPGTEDSPIIIRPESPGGVILSGATEFRLSGSYVTVSGFVFRDILEVSEIFQFRTHSERHAHNCRVTDTVFEQTSESPGGIESKWLSVYGTKNRIDHCFFAGKKSRGTTLVVWVNEIPGEHRIDHNHFGPRPELGQNGGETIRIGTSQVSEFDSKTIIENNYFHKCNGEAEIISNKSCLNIYRFNLFDECSGALTLRHGHRCLVDGNVFLGRKARGTGGVRIIGSDHVVTNNYFEGLRGDAARAAICLMNGIPDGPLHGYAPVDGALISHNTFIDCKVTMEIGVGANKKQSSPPANCKITHNAMLPGKWQTFRIHSSPSMFEWISNLHQSGNKDFDQPIKIERTDLDLIRANDGLLRPKRIDSIRTKTNSTVTTDLDGYLRTETSLTGCDDPTTEFRTLPSAGNTGPRWLAY